MEVIYTPRGRAREYSPKALNLYLTCTHGCKYCYVPKCINTSTDDYFRSPQPRSNVLKNLESQLRNAKITEQTLLSFVGDPYSESMDGNATTRATLEMLQRYKVPTAILTKGGYRCLLDIDLFKKFGEHIMVGSTLTFADEALSKEWESGAATPKERIATLKILHENGIKTFASFEPVIDPDQSLEMMRMSVPYVDLYKIGKLNGYPQIENKINWSKFLRSALDILRPFGKEIYVKDDLARKAPDVKLTPEERDADLHAVR